MVLACRNLEKAEAAAERLRGGQQGAQVRVVRLDLASLTSVRQCAQELLDTEPAIHLLINNAGLWPTLQARLFAWPMCPVGCLHIRHFNVISHGLLYPQV